MPCFSELLMFFLEKKSFDWNPCFFRDFWSLKDFQRSWKLLPWCSQEDHSFQCTFLVTPSHWEETMMIFPVYMLGHVGCHVPRSKRWFSTRLTLDAWGRVSCASVDGMARVAWMVEGGRIRTLNRRMLLGVESWSACNLLSPPAAATSMSVDIWKSSNIIVRK